MISSPSENEDIDFEPEDELGSVGAMKAKMQKLRDELAAAKKERQEYLDGWQRAQADLINVKKESAAAVGKARTAGAESFIEELIPALDSFDMAMQSVAWLSVEPAWRTGVESIRSQIVAALKTHGVELFGTQGEFFDPILHEIVSEEDGGSPHTIARVLRSGYRTKERVLRPAQVIIFK